jgi:hypothetical protein
MYYIYIVVEHMAKKIKHNDLTHYFLRDHRDLPPAYLASCKEFFDTLHKNYEMTDDYLYVPVCRGWHPESEWQAASFKLQATSRKRQAASYKRQALDKVK